MNTLSLLSSHEEPLLTVEEVAKFLKVPNVTVQRLISTKELRAIKFRGITRVTTESFE